MSILTPIIKWLTKAFWPWFVKYGWPIIKEHVIELVAFILAILKKKIKEYIHNKSQKREENARQQAEDAERKASSATSSTDSDKYHAIAQVWREVAEMFRKDNEDLKQRIEELLDGTVDEVKSEIENLNITADFSETGTLLTIGDKKKELPLPKEV